MRAQDKVSVTLGYEPGERIMTPNGPIQTQRFINRVNKKTKFFSSKITPIVDKFAGDTWTVEFRDYFIPELEKFSVHIMAQDLTTIHKIVGVVSNYFPAIPFSFYVKGQKSPFSYSPFFT